MNAKFLSWLVMLLTLPTLFCTSAPAPNRAMYEDNGNAIRQLRTTVSDLRHELSNHESEIRMFQERLHNQEVSFDHLRQELSDSIQAQKDFSRASNINLDGKIESLDNTVKGLIIDLKQIKTQSNESVSVLGQYKQKLVDLEKIIEAQNQHMRNLEAALNSIMEVLQAKELAEKAAMAVIRNPDGNKVYKVQSGDSLEKIARFHKVSVQSLRDYNNLMNDRIMIGQTLKIPP